MVQQESKYENNKTRNDTVQVVCPSCKRTTKHRVTNSLDEQGSATDYAEGWSVDWTEHYQIIQCQGCDTPSFRHTSWQSEGDGDGTERLFPLRNLEEREAKAFRNVPQNLRRIYGELLECFNNDSSTLCAAGLRAVVEGVCANQGIKNGPVVKLTKSGDSVIKRMNNLEGQIAGLEEKGLLTRASAKTLHQHRYLGNDAVHELARPSRDELSLAIEIVEHILDHLYEMPKKAEMMERAKAVRKPPK